MWAYIDGRCPSLCCLTPLGSEMQKTKIRDHHKGLQPITLNKKQTKQSSSSLQLATRNTQHATKAQLFSSTCNSQHATGAKLFLQPTTNNSSPLQTRNTQIAVFFQYPIRNKVTATIATNDSAKAMAMYTEVDPKLV